jgi:hypothetical protein
MELCEWNAEKENYHNSNIDYFECEKGHRRSWYENGKTEVNIQMWILYNNFRTAPKMATTTIFTWIIKPLRNLWIVIITRNRYNWPFSGQRAKGDPIGLHPPLCKLKKIHFINMWILINTFCSHFCLSCLCKIKCCNRITHNVILLTSSSFLVTSIKLSICSVHWVL